MLKSLRVFVVLGVAFASVGLNVGASHATPDIGWSTFEDVAGLVAANTGEEASIASVSCTTAGNCSAGGYYHVGEAQQAFVVSQVDGVWGSFEDVPGLVVANTGEEASIYSVSCTSAGNCSAGGSYNDNLGFQAFVVSQVDGVWGSFENVPGLVAANYDGVAMLQSVSCSSAGNCSAGGSYKYEGTRQVFVVSQVDGAWQSFENVPDLPAANVMGYSSLYSVSCTTAGNCSAGGFYLDGSSAQQAFVVSQVDGAWQSFENVPGLAAANTIGVAKISTLSCTSVGNCVAGGQYTNSLGAQAFLVSQVNGVWQAFEDVPGLPEGNVGGYSSLFSVSCASAGSCSAVGVYASVSDYRAFVVSRVDGVWRSFEEVSGLAAVNTDVAILASVSCASAGNCAAGGYYTSVATVSQAFLVLQVDGVWGTYEDVPGLTAANTGGVAGVNSVSCGAAGDCSAGGSYKVGAAQQAFLTAISAPLTESTTTTTTTTEAPPTSATISPSTAVLQNLPATGGNSSSTAVFSLLLILSGALVVGGLRRRIG
jgi:LPXTG-motif cell wall-anchored protein